jgi:hypothetical protein
VREAEMLGVFVEDDPPSDGVQEIYDEVCGED